MAPLLHRAAIMSRTRGTHVDNELSVDGAGVDTNSPEARKQLDGDPAINVHLTTQEEILY